MPGRSGEVDSRCERRCSVSANKSSIRSSVALYCCRAKRGTAVRKCRCSAFTMPMPALRVSQLRSLGFGQLTPPPRTTSNSMAYRWAICSDPQRGLDGAVPAFSIVAVVGDETSGFLEECSCSLAGRGMSSTSALSEQEGCWRSSSLDLFSPNTPSRSLGF
ncbi:hypothetical protein KC325_g291 [Hortaea werneckii]|nr:hypothetical protein KC325_g291 [Hortaea werneckii]